MIKLTDQQIKYLGIFNGLKSAYRQAELNKVLGESIQKEIEHQLIGLNVLKKTKSGALKSNYDWYGINDLISLNSETLESMVDDLRQAELNLSAKISDDKRLTETDKHYFLYQQDVLKSICFYEKKIEQLKNRIELKQKFDKVV